MKTWKDTVFPVFCAVAIALAVTGVVVGLDPSPKPETRYALVPTEDITAYELAKCWKAIETVRQYHQDPKATIESLEPNVRRHFKEQPLLNAD